jgi:hypothetical protein
VDGLRVLDLRRVDDHLQSGFWLRGGLLSSGRRGGLPGGYLHQLGGSPSGPLHLWCQILHGHRRWDFAPFDFRACQREDKCISDYDYSLGGYYSLSRVLTFDHAGFGQRSLSSRHFGLRLRGGSGLLGGRRDFFFRHRRKGFIPLPGQIRRLPVEYTSRLSVKQDYHIKYYSGRSNTYRLDRTIVMVGAPRMLAMSTSPASAGASSCASAAAAPSAVSAAGAAEGSDGD